MNNIFIFTGTYPIELMTDCSYSRCCNSAQMGHSCAYHIRFDQANQTFFATEFGNICQVKVIENICNIIVIVTMISEM